MQWARESRHLYVRIDALGLCDQVVRILLCLLLGSHLFVHLAIVGSQVVHLELQLSPLEIDSNDLRLAKSEMQSHAIRRFALHRKCAPQANDNPAIYPDQSVPSPLPAAIDLHGPVAQMAALVPLAPTLGDSPSDAASDLDNMQAR